MKIDLRSHLPFLLILHVFAASSVNSIAGTVCYKHVKECSQRDEQGGQLMCPKLQTNSQYESFLTTIRKTKGIGVIAFHGDKDLNSLMLTTANRHCVPNCRAKFALVEDKTFAKSLGYQHSAIAIFRGFEEIISNVTISADDTVGMVDLLRGMKYTADSDNTDLHLLHWYKLDNECTNVLVMICIFA